MKTSKFLLISFFLLPLCSLIAQYDYTVSTILPPGGGVINDGLCLDPNGTLYGSYWGVFQGVAGQEVLRYRANGSYDTLAIGFENPNGMTFHNGQVLVASSGTHIMAIDTATGDAALFTSIGGVSSVLSVPGADSLVAISFSQNRVYGIGPDTVISILSSSSLYNGPIGIAIDTLGQLYIANFNNGRIIRLIDGTPEVFTEIGGGIAFITYSDGAILATNYANRRVYRIPIDSAVPEVIAGSGQATLIDGVGLEAAFEVPNGIIATPSGDTIYISEFETPSLRMIVRTPTVSNNGQPATAAVHPNIFPIPANNQLQLEQLDFSVLAKGDLRDANGKVIILLPEDSLRAGQLDLSNIPSGMYWLTLYDRHGRQISRIQIPIQK
ncbi:MAG: hypothetical protein AAFQ37_10140 [Bacteroidota bacterium]